MKLFSIQLSFVGLALFLFSFNVSGIVPHNITLFIRQFPEPEKDFQYDLYKTKANMANPLKTASKFIKKAISNQVNGIFALYSGQAAVSNNIGEITFLRYSQKPQFYLLVTNQISPVFMFPNTIHHFETTPRIPASFYSVEQKQDTKTKLYFWDVKKLSPPKNNRIHKNTIVVISKPKNIVVPQGISLTSKSAQLVLPYIYTKKHENHAANALFMLAIKQFLATPQITEQQKGSSISQIVTKDYKE